MAGWYEHLYARVGPFAAAETLLMAGAGQGGRAGSPVSSTDDGLARGKGLPGLLPPQGQDSATSKNSLPKSASTSHLGGLNQMPPGPMVRPTSSHLDSSSS